MPAGMLGHAARARLQGGPGPPHGDAATTGVFVGGPDRPHGDAVATRVFWAGQIGRMGMRAVRGYIRAAGRPSPGPMEWLDVQARRDCRVGAAVQLPPKQDRMPPLARWPLS
jgi:hypothetical protein